MKFPKKYKCLDKNVFSHNEYKILPICFEHRIKIMKWRNEQIYHLRQKKKLTSKEQDIYFENFVYPQFDKKTPDQILFSFFKKKTFIGYGGLVHINWNEKNAEISFLIETKMERLFFISCWDTFLILIERVAKNIKINKIFTYAYDIRPKIYEVLENQGFSQEKRLKDKVIIDGVYKDVLIHSKIVL